MKLLIGLLVATAAVAVPIHAQDRAPEFKAIKWYNTAAIGLEDLAGKAVLIQVFRTW